VNSLLPSWGERDDLPRDTAAIEDGDDEGPPTIEIPVPVESELAPEMPQPALVGEVLSAWESGSADQGALATEASSFGSTESLPRQRLRFVGLGGGLVIVGMVVVAVTYLVNTPAEPSAGTALPQARTGPRDDTGSRPVSTGEAIGATGSPSAEPSVTGSAASASLSPSSPVGGVPSEPVLPAESVQPATPPVVSEPSPPGPPPEAELRAIYSTVERTGRARLRGQVVVSNVSDTTAVGWQVTIRLPKGGTISNSDGVDFKQDGSTVRFTPRGSARKIAPGGTVRFTFEVRRSKGGEPTGCFINDRPCG
jgi:Cellulose binding domain